MTAHNAAASEAPRRRFLTPTRQILLAMLVGITIGTLFPGAEHPDLMSALKVDAMDRLTIAIAASTEGKNPTMPSSTSHQLPTPNGESTQSAVDSIRTATTKIAAA